jgi:tetratricopeptide (TPR) repeat protein
VSRFPGRGSPVTAVSHQRYEFFEPADSLVRAAPKEKKMKRNLSLWLGLLAFALLPALAQTPMGKIHGHVINPTGAPEKAGTITLVGVDRLASGPGMSATTSDRGVFQVDANGSYSGEVKPGIYKLVFRTPGMSADKEADHIDNVQVVAGKDTLQDDDMSRKEYIDALPADVRKNLEEIRKKNAEAMKANEGIRIIIADANVCSQDFKDADNAPEIAARTLGGTPSKAEIEAKATEIKIAKYTEIETLMMKDTALRPTESSLWAQLGQAQVGLARAQGDQKKFDDAETSLKKVLEVEATAKKPNPSAQGVAYSSLGEIYAHTGKVPEANAAYDSAAKANPAGAANYLKNEAVIFSQVGNGDASAAAADKAILADPTLAIAYYLKGQGLIQKATIDPATGKMVLPPGCAEAYQKYLDLAPNGAFAADVKAILTEATQTHNTAFGDNKTKKKK